MIYFFQQFYLLYKLILPLPFRDVGSNRLDDLDVLRVFVHEDDGSPPTELYNLEASRWALSACCQRSRRAPFGLRLTTAPLPFAP